MSAPRQGRGAAERIDNGSLPENADTQLDGVQRLSETAEWARWLDLAARHAPASPKAGDG